MDPTPGDVTRLLQHWSDGSREALDDIVPLVYDQLRALARQRLRAEHGERTLDTTGLVHEAYVRLAELERARFRDRGHFLSMASRVMRRLLVDHARARRAAKRGGGVVPVELADDLYLSDDSATLIAEVDEALDRLEHINPRQCRIVEQRFFGGLSLEETAEALALSLATVKRDLRFARAWLAVELRGDLSL